MWSTSGNPDLPDSHAPPEWVAVVAILDHLQRQELPVGENRVYFTVADGGLLSGPVRGRQGYL